MQLTKILLPCLLLVAVSASARAGDCGNLALAYLYGYNAHVQTQSFGPAPPYFAIHPPVYYGQRYYRPYGASPYAAWPQLQANPDYAPRAGSQPTSGGMIITNPHFAESVVPAVVEKPVSNRVVEPLIIDNPYFQAQETQYTATKQ